MPRALKQLLLSLSLIAIVVLLANLMHPPQAVRLGTGFTSITPSVSYPIRLAGVLAGIYFMASLFLQRGKLAATYGTLLLLALGYLGYCIQTYVTPS